MTVFRSLKRQMEIAWEYGAVRCPDQLVRWSSSPLGDKYDSLSGLYYTNGTPIKAPRTHYTSTPTAASGDSASPSANPLFRAYPSNLATGSAPKS